MKQISLISTAQDANCGRRQGKLHSSVVFLLVKNLYDVTSAKCETLTTAGFSAKPQQQGQ